MSGLDLCGCDGFTYFDFGDTAPRDQIETSLQYKALTRCFPVFSGDHFTTQRCNNTGANETYCLDECGGYEGELPGVDFFLYRYYMVKSIAIVQNVSGL